MKYKKLITHFVSQLLIVLLCLNSAVAQASGSTAAQGHPWMDWAMRHIVFVLAVIVMIMAGRALWNAMNIVLGKYQATLQPEEAPTSIEEKGPSIWSKLYDRAWQLVPMDKESDIDLGHDYDGIKELDNRLPPWWLYLFYATILWGAAYVYIYHWSDLGPSQSEEYEQEMEYAAAMKLAQLSKMANAVDESNVTITTDEKELAEGRSIFLSQCAACHGQAGEGGVGPNFTDAYWIHGGSIQDLFKTIKYGVPEKGMISWKSLLSPSAMRSTASYILTLQGTDPPNQKDPEGTLYQAEESD